MKRSLITLAVLLVIPLGFYAVFRTHQVQTWIVSKITGSISKDLKVNFTIDHVDITWFLDLELKGVYLSDQHHDTLVSAEIITLDLEKLRYRKGMLYLNALTLEKPVIRLSRKAEEPDFNYQCLIDYFSADQKKPERKSKPWDVRLRELDIRDARFSMHDYHHEDTLRIFNPSHVMLNSLWIDIQQINYSGDSLTARLSRLSFKEKCGFQLQNTRAGLKITPRKIQLNDLLLRTEYSRIESDLSLSFDSIEDFNSFYDQVNWDARLMPSEFDIRDLEFFSSDLKGLNNQVIVSGFVKGPVSKLKIDSLNLDFGAYSHFEGNVRLTGLPDIQETYIQLNVNELSTNHRDLNNLVISQDQRLQVPHQIEQLGTTHVKGNFTGFVNDFVADATFKTEIGIVTTDISLKTNAEDGKLEYSGNVRSREFDLGLLLGERDYLGKINLMADVTGSGFDLDHLLINMDAVVDSLDFKGNNFKEIHFSGGVFQKKISGNFQVTDPLLKLDFDGFVDLSKEKPEIEFISSVDHAALNRLNLITHDSLLAVSTRIHFAATGTNPDDLKARLQLDSTVLSINGKRSLSDHLDLQIQATSPFSKELTLTSDIADARVEGSFTYSNLVPMVNQWMKRLMPSLFPAMTGNQADSGQFFNFKVTIHDAGLLNRLYLPQLSLSPHTLISGVFNPSSGDVHFEASSDQCMFNKVTMLQWYLDGTSSGIGFNLSSGCQRVEFSDEMGLDNIQLDAITTPDTIILGLAWSNPNITPANSGDFRGEIQVLASDSFRIRLQPSMIVINDSIWNLLADNLLEINKDHILIRDIRLNSGDENVKLDGIISPDPDDKMLVRFNGFDLSNMDYLTLPQQLDLDGYLSGQVELTDLYHTPNLLSDLQIRSFGINKDRLGNASITTQWDPGQKALIADAEIKYQGNIGSSKIIGVKGKYYPDKKDNCLDFNIQLDKFRLNLLTDYLSSFSSRIKGYASGELSLKGNLQQPELNGKIKIQHTSLLIDYLKTEYSISHEIEVGKDFFRFTNATILDTNGNAATLSGSIYHKNFRDFRIDLNIKPEKLLVLNTNSKDNDLFYGRAFATGEVKIQGPTENLVMDIKAKTEKGTQVFLPINLAMDVSDNDYIHFTTALPDSSGSPAVRAPVFHGVTLNFDLEVTPDATMKIFMPMEMGNIKGSGHGLIKMAVNTRGLFTILGDFQIDQGTFLFTLQNVVNRLFEIQPGGKIMFTGDPYATQLDLRALYRIDVPLTGLRLSSDQLQSMNKKMPINCIIDLKNSLFNPDLGFGLSTLEKDPEINRILFSQLDTTNQQQMSEQMIFLLILKQFKPMERSNPLDFNASVGSSSWDFLSSQLNNWLSQISKDFDIGVNYKPGDRLTDDELTVALSTQLFDERITIDGNIGYASGTKNPSSTGQNASNLVGDVKIEWKLTKDGRFRIKAYNKSNNVSYFENNAPFTQGVGIFFRKEFDSFKDLFRSKKRRGTT